MTALKPANADVFPVFASLHPKSKLVKFLNTPAREVATNHSSFLFILYSDWSPTTQKAVYVTQFV